MAVTSKVENSREKVRRLLRELFQFDAQDLDFGIYRILNFRRKEIERFIEKELIEAVEAEFKEYAKASVADLQKELDKLKAEINRDFGEGTIDERGIATKHKDTPKILEYMKKVEGLKCAEVSETQMNEVFNLVYEFFSRYYDKGDFISKRRYGGKEKYLVPYSGEEIVLHWANKDQYYIKTTDYFSNYHFKAGTYRVNILLIKAEVEGKDNDGKRQYFILRETNFLKIDTEKKYVEIYYEYRTLSDEEIRKYGTRNTQDESTKEAINRIFSEIDESPVGIELKLKVDDEGRTLLEKHLNSYVQRNTTDFFIHKNLAVFLERELEFFIKNEVLDIDLLIDFDATNLHLIKAKVKVIREISKKIIDFLAQIEDFQKRLWEKRKFILNTDYIVTIDKLSKDMIDEVLKNKPQLLEWEALGFGKITKERDLIANTQKKLTEVNTVGLKKLPIDTKHFTEDFKKHLLEKISEKGPFDAQIDGLLIKSENWQALNLLCGKYNQKVKCVYIDPPYNTGHDDFLYKDNYQHSTWLSMLESRFIALYGMLNNDGVLFVSVDDNEVDHLRILLNNIFGEENFIAQLIVQLNPRGRTLDRYIAKTHEYILVYAKKSEMSSIREVTKSEDEIEEYDKEDKHGKYRELELRNRNPVFNRKNRPNLYYPIFVNSKTGKVSLIKSHDYSIAVFPRNLRGEDGCWTWGKEKVETNIEILGGKNVSTGAWRIYRKDYLNREDGSLATTKIKSIWLESSINNENGKETLRDLFGGESPFNFPKSVELIRKCIELGGANNEIVLDFFAGSGTTTHAVILQNSQKQDEKHKFIIVEMADYFDSVIIPRLKKNIYSLNWKDGKPQDDDGQSVMVKYFSLEQYEDTLNNIIFLEKNKTVQETLDEFGDYLLKNMLEFETRGSPTRLSVQQFQTPFEYKLWVAVTGEKQLVTVDLVETFNYLLGITVEKIKAIKDSDHEYRVVIGKKKDEKIGIIWRNLKDIDLKSDKKIIENVILAGIKLDRLFINGDSLIERAEPIEPEFKRLMGA